MPQVRWLGIHDPPDAFPDPHQALDEPDGLVAIGGDLGAERLLAAYRRGIFPWYNAGQPILWWSPDPRAVLLPGDLHVSRSLRRTLRRAGFEVSTDQAFAAVIDTCAALREATGTWITPEMRRAYLGLHAAGHAHSVEVWRDGGLVGGLYGVNLGRVFFGESMFSRVSDASKVALVALMDQCRHLRIELVDCQVASAHLARLGSRALSRDRFLGLLDRYCDYPDPGPWPRPPGPAAQLA